MVRDGDGVTWRGHWSSIHADDGICFWHISTDGTLPAADFKRPTLALASAAAG